MAPDEFRREVKRRGWTIRALAERWDVTEGYVSRLASTAERPMHWDDAVRGLPTLIIQKQQKPPKNK